MSAPLPVIPARHLAALSNPTSADLSWEDVWSLYVWYCMIAPEDPKGSFQRELLRAARAARLAVFLSDHRCEVCLDVLPADSRSDRAYCSSACSQKGLRIRSKRVLTPLAYLRKERLSADQTVRAKILAARHQGAMPSDPPCWIGFQGLPSFPRDGCASRSCSGVGTCAITRQSACLLAGTKGS